MWAAVNLGRSKVEDEQKSSRVKWKITLWPCWYGTCSVPTFGKKKPRARGRTSKQSGVENRLNNLRNILPGTLSPADSFSTLSKIQSHSRMPLLDEFCGASFVLFWTGLQVDQASLKACFDHLALNGLIGPCNPIQY